MRTKMFLLIALLILTVAFAAQTYADFAQYSSERIANTSVVPPPDALIGFTCGRSLEVEAGGSNSAIATIVTNTLEKPIDVNVQFYGWVGNPTGLTPLVQLMSDHFTLSPGESKNVWITVEAEQDASAGAYGAILRFSVVWDGGNADILTSPCPLEVIVKAPRIRIEKVLISGPTEVPLFTRFEWTIRISVDTSVDGLLVTDTIPGEFELISYTSSKGTVTTETRGHSTHITWELDSSGFATLDLRIATKLNPAERQEFTSPGRYSLNNGACIRGTDICTDPIFIMARR